MQEKYKVSVNDALSMAVELHKHGEVVEARSLYVRVLDVVPEHPDALHYLGIALHQLGESDDAERQILRSLEFSPNNASAINNLGNVYREVGRLEEAELAYRRVLEFAPDHADTLVNLGIILRERREFDEALKILDRALEIDPDNAAGFHNLGNVYKNLERHDDAIAAFAKARELSPEDEKATLAMANVQYAAGRNSEAVTTLKDMLLRYPGHASATHLLAAFTGENVPSRASDRYVRQLFDTFAPSFDEALTRLDYMAPQMVAERLLKNADVGDRNLRILDIGCGTGLCGPLVKKAADSLTGVDLSSGMLKKAARRGVYDRLEEAELTEFMRSTSKEFDAIICVDTFVYFGDLAEALTAAHGALRERGRLIFTVERHGQAESLAGFRLQHHGRYSHSKPYVAETLEGIGFEVAGLDDVVLRMENRKPVEGILAMALRK